MALFDKILIANRGEIACRIISTCKQLKIKTVAVYSQADISALHVEMADEAYLLGPAPASESYLNQDKILEVIKKSGAQAVHPGYGFLSENADFARLLSNNGVKLIGPSAHVIEIMGDKIKARHLAEESNVSVIPGVGEAVTDQTKALEIAHTLGYPVMVKAAAGGGGKGMRLAYSDQEVIDGLSAAMREAKSSFGDDRVFIEKFIENPRHIEVQVLADSFGTVLHLGERECSLQRRHQKVLEESPSFALQPQTRQEICEQAVKLAKSVGYQSAGTVEFIMDPKQNFYFLEMNTRLQVEHPVTEAVTGRDLVEDMIRIAAGEPLIATQSDIEFNGFALEARVYAEDPTLDFIPSPGTLTRYQEPLLRDHSKEQVSVRIDSGVEEGDTISPYYDPMISKVIVHGSSRELVYKTMGEALNSYDIKGLNHNLGFLQHLVNSKDVREGSISTLYIDKVYKDGFDPSKTHVDEKIIASVIQYIYGPSDDEKSIIVSDNGIVRDLKIAKNPAYKCLELTVNSIKLISKEGEVHTFVYSYSKPNLILKGYGAEFTYKIYPSHLKTFLRHLPDQDLGEIDTLIKTPMPGKLIKLMVAEGDMLKKGQPVAIVEAMKMENVIRSHLNSKVKSICVPEGQNLVSGQALVDVG